VSKEVLERAELRKKRRTVMNDIAAPWVDPELIAAGQLLQSKGLVSPDRTKASIAEVRAADRA